MLGWLPRGTHQWERFVTPDELARHVAAAGLAAPRLHGLRLQSSARRMEPRSDTDVNYLASAAKPS